VTILEIEVSDSELFVRFAVASAVAFGAGVSGLGLLLFGPKGWVGRGLLAATGVGAAAGATAMLTPEHAGWVLGVGLGLAACYVLAGVGAVQRRVGGLLRVVTRPRVVGGLVLFAAFGGWGLTAWQFDRQSVENAEATLKLTDRIAPRETVPADVSAVTDSGTPLALTVIADPLSAADSASLEENASSVAAYAPHLIRRGPASDDSNCHGWVFAGGRFHIGGRQVPTILADNGDEKVSHPAPGDVCVYAGDDGGVTHTAVVRATLDDGTVLVEGKWGRMGVYLHAAAESCYGKDFRFYHTTRGGHLLHGLDSSTAASLSHEP
jgi:hypothetical protein